MASGIMAYQKGDALDFLFDRFMVGDSPTEDGKSYVTIKYAMMARESRVWRS